MRRILLTAGLALLVGGVAACSDGGSGGGILGTVIAPFVGTSVRADLSGQEDVFVGTLGSGTGFTFPAVRNGSYNISIQLDDPDDAVVIDLVGDDGTPLKSRTLEGTSDAFTYKHENKSQHVLGTIRPRNPFSTDIGVRQFRIAAVGSFASDKVRVNFIIAGGFDGFGQHGDLKSAADQKTFTDALMQRVQQLFDQSGIAISYEGFAYDATQVAARHPNLVGPDGQTLCSTSSSMSSTGMELVGTQDLDLWGDLGFAEGDPSFERAHGIDVFLIHHFTNDGTVGLSPRPGKLLGNGPESAVAVAAFLQAGGSLTPRTIDQIALVTAHEIGHFLGLLHTTTFDPDFRRPTRAIDDGIGDTPACTVLDDNNGDGVVGIGDGCQDEGNIMFYQSGAQTVFSAGQAKVMKQLLSAQEH